MTTATLTGPVSDASGRLLANLPVVITHIGPANAGVGSGDSWSVQAWSGRTDASGQFSVDLPLDTDATDQNTYYLVVCGTGAHASKRTIRLSEPGTFIVTDPTIQAVVVSNPAIADPAGAAAAVEALLNTEVARAEAAEALLIPLAEMGVADGVATLGDDGKLTASQLPAIAIGETFVVNSQAAMLALAAHQGDLAVRADLSPAETYVLAGTDPTQLANWTQITTAGSVISVNGHTGAVALTAADVSAVALSGDQTWTGAKTGTIHDAGGLVYDAAAYGGIQQALDAADTNGGGVVRARGTFTPTQPYTYGANTRFDGGQAGDCIIAPVYQIGDPWNGAFNNKHPTTGDSNVVLCNFTLDRTNMPNAHGVVHRGGDGFEMFGVLIKGSPAATSGLVSISGLTPTVPITTKVRIHNNWFYDGGNFGVQLGYVDDALVAKNTFYNCYREVVGVEPDVSGTSAHDVTIIGNKIKTVPTGPGSATGIIVATTTGGPIRDLIIIGNTIEVIGDATTGGAGHSGITIQGAEAYTIGPNTIRNIPGPGIRIGTVGVTTNLGGIVGANIITNAGLSSAGTEAFGIELRNSSKTLVENNRIAGTYTAAIAETNSADANTILNNEIADAGGLITRIGANTRVTGAGTLSLTARLGMKAVLNSGVSVTAAHTRVCSLTASDGSTSNYSGVLVVTARQNETTGGNVATYYLLIDKAGAGSALSLLGQQGLTAGSSASWPSFTFDFDTANNSLVATPVGSTTGTFNFHIAAVGGDLVPTAVNSQANTSTFTGLTALFDASGAAATAQAASLQKTSNLSDLGSATTARTNLGLGSAATQASSAFDAAGAASAAVAAIPTDGTAGTGSLRTLGTGAQQAAGGADTRINQAVPQPILQSGRFYRVPNGSLGTTAAYGNNALRTVPFFIPASTTLALIGGEITAAGNAGSVVRLGIYADDGTMRPGTLIIDAGTIDGTSATAQTIACAVTLARGWYWFGAALQNAATTQPTIRTQVNGPWPPVDSGTTLPTAGAIAIAMGAGSVSGALPSTFTPGAQGTAPALFVKVA